MRAAGPSGGPSKSLQNETLFPKTARMVCADIRSRLRARAILWAFLLLARVQREERKRKEGGKKTRERGDKAVFKRVLTPRQGPGGPLRWRGVGPRELRLRVSRNPGLYAAVGALDAGSTRIAGPHRSYIFPGVGAPRQAPSSSEADVRARRTHGPRQARRGTSLSRLRCGRAVRAHASMRVLCAGSSVRISLPLSVFFFPLTARGFIVSARSAVIRHAGILTNHVSIGERLWSVVDETSSGSR